MPLDEQPQPKQTEFPVKELFLSEIAVFLRDSWLILSFFVLAGLACVSIYFWLTPTEYVASTVIRMAKMPSRDNLMGINVEEPTALIARMSSSTSFSPATISSCGFGQDSEGGSKVLGLLKLTIPKGLPSVVDLKVISPNQEMARLCAIAVAEQIATSQDLIRAPIIDAKKNRQAIVNERLKRDNEFLLKLDSSINSTSAYYFALLSGKRALEDEKIELDNLLSNNVLASSRMEYPIELAPKSIRTKTLFSLLVGSMVGFCLGLLVTYLVRLSSNKRKGLH